MHIEAGVVNGAKMILGYGTGATVVAIGLKMAWDNIKENGILSFFLKTIISIALVFTFFEVFPHYPVGVSEVHLILGTSLLMVFGVAPAMMGLALGLLLQGITVAQFDLPQYGINVTTLLASMLILYQATKKIVSQGTAYKDISYLQMLKMSLIWEGAIVSWVAFWAFYGQGFTAENIHNILIFGGAYMLVVILEPLIDLAILSAVKAWYKSDSCNILFDKRLTNCKA
ncbi:MAG: energy-coupling factor ABC transporter permease [Sulfurovaceae bacterium]|nr:energy-coupling factor ABC transporter permease [Sulfurovaceae bacterium]